MARLTVQFPPKVNQMLDRLSATDQTTKTDVIRRALALYDFVQNETNDGHHKLSITDDKDKVRTNIVLH